MSFIVMLNDHALYEHILEDEIFFGVVGMLECGFCFPSVSVRLPKTCYLT